MPAPEARLWLAERVAEMLPGVELLGYARLAAPQQHELVLRDPATGVTVVLRLPQSWIDAYKRDDRARLESAFLTARERLDEAASRRKK